MARITRVITDIYAENVVNSFFSFDNVDSWTSTNGGSASHDANTVFNGRRSLRVTNTDPNNGNTVASISGKGTVINEPGNYWVVCYVRNDTNEQITGSFRTYKNTALENTEAFTLEIADEDKWVGQWSYITGLLKGDTLEFDFVINHKTTTLPNIPVNIDGFGVYHNDRDLTLPPRYTQPFKVTTGWQKRVDTSTVALTTDTDTTISFAGTSTTNGLTLLDGNAKVTPIYEGDAMLCKLTIDIDAPATADEHIDIKFVVNSVELDRTTHLFTKSSGTSEKVTFTLSEEVTTAFKTNGGTFVVNCSAATNITNREVLAIKTHNAL